MEFSKKAFNTTSNAVMVINSTAELIWVNKAFEQNLGYSLAYIKKTDRWPFLAADHQEKVLSIISQAFSGNPLEAFDIPVICSDNTIKTIRWNTMLVDNKPGQKAVAVFGIAARSHERNKSHLGEIEDRYRIIFENSSIGLMYADEKTKITLVNREFEKITGCPKGQVESKMSWTALIVDEEDLMHLKSYDHLRRVAPGLAPEGYNAGSGSGALKYGI